MEEREIREKLIRALDVLVQNDVFLLSNNVNERSISHRLAVYLENEFPNWHVDCEYNRAIENPKRLNIEEIDSESTDTNGKTVFPDIIVHRRGEQNNLLVVEMKKTTSNIPDDFDYLKLQAFKAQLGYRFAVFIKMKTMPNDTGYNDPVWF
ncbi:hypothetical protein [Tolumonas lignilytica]|uniref:hypothetical protein n=1 Tax=Tolumonas lignilytica TaxID=1283284 RepID=UPI000467D740|nr:hypothetical protein [Tolumonas lignilytica]